MIRDSISSRIELVYYIMLLVMLTSCINKTVDLPPRIMSERDITTLEQYCNFQFPGSTNIIRTYMYPNRLYMGFNFKGEDIGAFMNSLDWIDKVELQQTDEMKWIDTIDESDNFWGMVSCPRYKYKGYYEDGPREELQWWHLNKTQIEIIFWVSNPKIKNIDVWIDFLIILEKQEDLYYAYVCYQWQDVEEKASYMKDMYHRFPTGSERISEPRSVPLKNERK